LNDCNPEQTAYTLDKLKRILWQISQFLEQLGDGNLTQMNKLGGRFENYVSTEGFTALVIKSARLRMKLG